MARAHTKHQEQHAWVHTASILAMLHNANCTKRSDLKSGKDFYPKGLDQEEPAAEPTIEVPFEAMKNMFGAREPGEGSRKFKVVKRGKASGEAG